MFKNFLIFCCLILTWKQLARGQSIGYGLPNFGLYYNPYTSPAFGYGLGPQFSTLRGSLAAGLLYGGHGGLGGYGAGFGGLSPPGLMGIAPGMGLGTPIGPYGLNAQPWLYSYHGKYGPYGRFPGQTGTYGYGTNTGYGVYNGYGLGGGGGYPPLTGGYGYGSGALSGHGDFDDYINRGPDESTAPVASTSTSGHFSSEAHNQRLNSKMSKL